MLNKEQQAQYDAIRLRFFERRPDMSSAIAWANKQKRKSDAFLENIEKWAEENADWFEKWKRDPERERKDRESSARHDKWAEENAEYFAEWKRKDKLWRWILKLQEEKRNADALNADADEGDIVGFFAAGENKQPIPIKEGQSKEEAFKEKKAEWEAEKEAEESVKSFTEKKEAERETQQASDEPIELTGNELGAYKDIKELREKAREYYKEHLQGKTIEREGLGKVRFSGKGIRETIAHSPQGKEDKLKVIPVIERIIQTGKIGKEEPIDHPRKDEIVAFVPVTQTIKVDGKAREAEVLLGKDKQGNWYYDLFLDQSR